MSDNSDQDYANKQTLQMQIYKTILDFKHREPNPYGLKRNYLFRYNSFNPLDGIDTMKGPTEHLYVYIVTHLRRYLIRHNSDINEVVDKSMLINLHPDTVGIVRQNIKTYLDELVDLNFICKAGERGYDYYVNPYYYNVLSRPLAEHCFIQMQQLLEQAVPLP